MSACMEIREVYTYIYNIEGNMNMITTTLNMITKLKQYKKKNLDFFVRSFGLLEKL